MDVDRLIQLLEECGGHLVRMLVAVELGIETERELPRLLQGDWIRFQDAIRGLLATEYEVPHSWQILAFSRVPVPPVHEPGAEMQDALLAVQEEESHYGLKLDYKAWSKVCNEIRAAIEVLSQLSHSSGTGADWPEATDSKNEEWPRINLVTDRIEWRGTSYLVSGNAAYLFDALVRAKGDLITASKTVSRPSRVIQSLPDELKSLIVSSNKGYRLEIHS